MVAAWIATACATAGALALLLAPLGASVTTSMNSTGEVLVEETRLSLMENEGWSVAIVLAVPVLIAGVGAALARARGATLPLVISAGLLWGFAILGLLSIGLFFLPAAMAMTVAALRR